MYKEEEAEVRVVQMSPILRGLAEEMLRRGNQFDHRVPLDEAFDSDLEEQLRLALSEPALKQEWEEFWQAFRLAHQDRVGHLLDTSIVMHGILLFPPASLR